MNTLTGGAASPWTKHKDRADKAQAAPCGRMQRARVTRTPRETLQGRATLFLLQRAF